MNNHGKALTITIFVLAIVSTIATIASVLLQWTGQQPSTYETMITESCISKGYESSTFTDQHSTVPGQPQCCTNNYCVSYDKAMQYGPGYEPTSGDNG